MKLLRTAVVILLLILSCPPPSFAQSPMTYIHHPPESLLDSRYLYQWEVLRTALEKTVAQYGPYTIRESEVMSERRQVQELKSASGKLTVIYLDTTTDRERELLPIRIPIDKNLTGYRVLLIRKEDQPAFAAIDSLADLRHLSGGLQADWSDVQILRANGSKVVVGSNYEGLFEMLSKKRFDYFSRGVNEVIVEYTQRKGRLSNLHIEETLLLHYVVPMYFWFSPTDAGRHQARRVADGLAIMRRDGTFEQLFSKFHGNAIRELKLDSRKIIHLDNPLLPPATPLQDRQLWFDPKDL